MKTQIPLYRAKKIDSDRYIEGLLTTNLFDNYCIKYVDFDTSMYVDEIDPSTLSISFDGGNSWYSDFESIADICREYLPKIEQKA